MLWMILNDRWGSVSDAITTCPWGFAKFQKTSIVFHLVWEYFVSLWLILVVFLVAVATMRDIFNQTLALGEQSLFLLATLASSLLNIYSSLYDYHYIKTNIGHVQVLESSDAEMERCRTALRAMQKDRMRFRRHVACWITYCFAIVCGVFAVVLKEKNGDEYMFQLMEFVFVYMIFKAILLNLYPFIRFWIMYKYCGKRLPIVCMGGIHPVFLEMNSVELEVDNRSDDCVICFDDYEINKTARRLRCGHVFHKNCIDEWFTRSSVCPLCKTDMNDDS